MKILFSLPPAFCFILTSLVSSFSQLLGISRAARSFLSASSFCKECSVCFLNLPSLPKHLRPPLTLVALFCSVSTLLRCPSCKTAPGINTPFQVWSYAFPAAARQELYFQVQNHSGLILDRVQRSRSSVRILILVVQAESSCLRKQSPSAAMRCLLRTLISICLFRLWAFSDKNYSPCLSAIASLALWLLP